MQNVDPNIFKEHGFENFSHTIVDGESFFRCVPNLNVFEKIVQICPERRSEFIALAASHPRGVVYLAKMIQDIGVLIENYAADQYEQIREDFLNPEYTHFERCIKTINDLITAARWFPKDINRIVTLLEKTGGVSRILSNVSSLQRVKRYSLDLAVAVAKSPPPDEDVLYKLIKNSDQLIWFCKFYSAHKDLFKAILKRKISGGDFRGFVRSRVKLLDITQYFSEEVDAIFACYFSVGNPLDFNELHKLRHMRPFASEPLWRFIQKTPKLYDEIVKTSEQHAALEQTSILAIDSASAITGEHLLVNPNPQDGIFVPIKRAWRRSQYFAKAHQSVFGCKDDCGYQPEQMLPKSFIPNRFSSLKMVREGRPVLSTCWHASKFIEQILQDGVIYPKARIGIAGLGDDEDAVRGDHHLVFTSLSSDPEYGEEKIELSVPSLCGISHKLNNSGNVIFKLFDWGRDFNHSIDLTDSVKLKISVVGFDTDYLSGSKLRFRFDLSGETKMRTTIDVPLHETIFPGYQGLNDYLRYFIFRVVEKIEFPYDLIQENIYDYFSTMSTQGLHSHLSRLAKDIFVNSELAFIGKVYLDYRMISTVVFHKAKVDVKKIRELIRENKADSLRGYLASPSVLKVLGNSFFLVKGLLTYAEQLEHFDILAYLKTKFSGLLNIENTAYSAISRKQGLQLLSADVVDFVFKKLSQKYTKQAQAAIVEDPEISVDGTTVYRPNHGSLLTMMTVAAVPFIIKVLKDNGLSPYAEQVADIDPLKVMQAMLFSVIGRKNDDGFYDDQVGYEKSRIRAGQLFYDFYLGRDEYQKDELPDYHENLVALGDPSNTDIIHIIMNLAHKIVLSRCYDEKKMNESQLPYIEQFFPTDVQADVARALLTYGTRMLDAVGDRILVSFDELIETTDERNTERFVFLSQRENFQDLLSVLSAVREPVLPEVESRCSVGMGKC